MKGLATSMRLSVAAVMLLALFGMSSALVGAQDGATPVASVASEPEPDAGAATVDVSCTYDPSTNQSTCTFAVVSESGGVDALVIPAAAICAPVVSSSGAATGDGGYRGEAAGGNPSVTLVLQGDVQPAGGATYVVGAADAIQEVGGVGLACQPGAPDLPAPPDDSAQTEAPADVGEGESNPAPPDESETIDDAAPADVEPAGTPAAVPLPPDDGTGVSDDEAAAQEDEVAAAALVPLTIRAYNCDDATSAEDPAASCAPALGVQFDVTVGDASPVTIATDANGEAVVDVEEGSSVEVVEDMGSVPAGYTPLSGSQIFDPFAAGTESVFVHLLVNGDGNLQIVNGSCPTSEDEPFTDIQVIGPRVLAGAEASSCMPTNGAVFTLQSDALPGGELVVQTGADGAWRGTVPAGDYTVVDDSGESEVLTVAPDSLTAVVVVDYIPQPDGTLTITRFLCTEGEEEGTSITVDSAPGSGGDGCSAGDGEMRLSSDGDGTGGAAEDFILGADGEAAFADLREGQYVLTDLATGASATITITADTVVAATVREVILTGRAVVQHNYCDDPAFRSVDPSNYAAFSDGCGRPYAGVPLTLFDGAGTEFGTAIGSGGGVTVWNQLRPGAYSLGGGDVCAIFAGGADARGGFSIAIGSTTAVEVFSCAAPNSGGSNDGTGGNTGDNGQIGGSGDGTGGGTAAGTGGLYVSQLPNTGVGNHASGSALFALTSFFIVAAAAGVNVLRRRPA
jgi:hypothetical protein